MTESESTLGARLRELRDALELSQEEFAERISIDASHLSRLERGQRKGESHATRQRIARAIGVSVERLDQYFAGEFDVTKLLRYSQLPTTIDPGSHEPSSFDEAIAAAFDASTHRLADLDCVRSIVSRADVSLIPAHLHTKVAKRLLDAAATTRGGGSVTLENVLLALAARE
jgi:transcriptional regulator with XRE-family HTH domain